MGVRRLFRFKSIHTNIALAFSCLILCTTLLLSYSSYRLSSRSVARNSLDYTAQLIDQVNTNIRNYIDNMESISSLALSNGDLQRFLSVPRGTPEAEALSARIAGFFHALVASRNDMAALLFVGSNGTVISDRPNAPLKDYSELIGQDWYQSARNAGGNVSVSSARVQHLYKGEYRWVVSMSKMLRGPGYGAPTGVLLVDLNYNVIDDLCRQISLGRRGYVFIVDSAGDLVYHPQQQILNTELKKENIPLILGSADRSEKVADSGEAKIYTIRSTGFGWKIVGVTYRADLAGDRRNMQLSAAMWGGLCLLAALGISIWLSFTLTRPIKQLDIHMKQVEKGNFDIRVDIASPNEIGKLARTFNLMIGKIRELMGQIVREQEIKRVSEIKALQAQIKPHFLYNTLDSIIWMAETNKMREVVEMTTALSKLFRASIGQGEGEVPLAVELEHIDSYMKIQAMRYRNKFTYAIDVAPELRGCPILRFVLQPLVENAIYHGLKNKAETGHIRIAGRRTGSVLELTVEDDGIGMDRAAAEALLAPAAGDAARTGSGVGVLNVHQRIRLLYGPSFGLAFDSEPEEGTTVTIRIPYAEHHAFAESKS